MKKSRRARWGAARRSTRGGGPVVVCATGHERRQTARTRGRANVMWWALLSAALLCLTAGLSGAATVGATRSPATASSAGDSLAQDTPPCPDASSPNNLVTVNPGDRFTLGLAANRTTGYSWQLAQPPDASVAQLVGSSYEAPTAAQPGAGGKECWTFNAAAAGTTQLTL